MRLISRIEEIVLLSIWRLESDAYGVSILREVRKATGRTWLTGSIYASLGRLLKRGLVESYEGEPAPERGGRRKIYYRITADGRRALKDIRKVHAALWADIPLFEGPDK
jgi:DNA-binding PadR family transcriptional regulator